mgnify:CR=1 FL=1
MSEAHDLLVELVAVVKTIPDTCDFDDLGSRIQAYLEDAPTELSPLARIALSIAEDEEDE